MRGIKNFIGLLFFAGIFFMPVFVFAANSSKDVNINLIVSYCNYDGICNNGEDHSVCPADCVAPPPVVPPSGGGGHLIPTKQSTTTLILNVDNLIATAGDGQVRLFWTIPIDLKDYKGIMIRRSTIFYPSDTETGGLLYQGGGFGIGNNSFEYIDTGLKNGVRYFYTIFVYNTNGYFSSGAIVSALPQSPEMEQIEKIEVKPIVIPPKLIVPKVLFPPKGLPVLFSDFIFEQKGEFFNSKNNKTVEVLHNAPIYIYLDNNKIPKNTKIILVTLENKGQIRTFLLKNDDKTSTHVVGLPAFGVEGSIKAIFTFLNNNNLAMGIVEGLLDSKTVFSFFKIQNVVSQPSALSILIGTVKKLVTQEYFWLWCVLIILFFMIKHWVDRW